MAYDPNQLYNSVTGPTSGKRIIPKVVQAKTFAAGTALLAVGTLVAYNTSTNFWVPWVTAGANGTGTVLGIVAQPIQLKAGVEVLGQVMLQGEIHRGDCVAAGAETSNQIDAALDAEVRPLGLIIQGLATFR